MEKLPKAEYSPEFREQAVRTYQESGLSVAEVAKRLSLPKSSLNNCVMAAKKGKLASVGKNQKPITEMEMELSRLKRELAETRMERGLLKKCTAYRQVSSVRSTKKKVAQRRCRWREVAFVHWLLSSAVNPCLSLFDCLEKWNEMLRFLREPPRKNRCYQQDVLRGGAFG